MNYNLMGGLIVICYLSPRRYFALRKNNESDELPLPPRSLSVGALTLRFPFTLVLLSKWKF